jgi:hypothetical protein
MTFRPNPKQALFLWNMITAETPEVREPMMSKAKPDLAPKTERKDLIDQGYLETEKRGSATHLILTDRAWAWAAEATDVELMLSNSRIGAAALQGLLRRLLPFMNARGIALADLFPDTTASAAALEIPATERNPAEPVFAADGALRLRVRAACLDLVEGKTSRDVPLASLRSCLRDIPRPALDAELRQMHLDGQIALYRNDNTAAVTPADERAALIVGDAPRHLLYLKD